MEYIGITLALIAIGLSLFNRTDARIDRKDIEINKKEISEIKEVVQLKKKK